jgi:ABC-type lipoprotein release transport system permease subunit
VAFEIVGIYRTGSPAFDRQRIYMHVVDLQRFSHLYDRVHEIAIAADSPDSATAVAAGLDAPTALVRTWKQIRPDIVQVLSTSEASMAVMVFIIFLVATLGVVNTMLMAVFERTRELGVLKAIGMSGRRIVALIVCETLLLVVIASAFGTLLGLAADLYLVRHGLDLSSFTGGFTMAGIGFDPVLRGAVTARGLIMPTVILSLTCLVASLYPAVRAARLRPAVGMRET